MLKLEVPKVDIVKRLEHSILSLAEPGSSVSIVPGPDNYEFTLFHPDGEVFVKNSLPPRIIQARLDYLNYVVESTAVRKDLFPRILLWKSKEVVETILEHCSLILWDVFEQCSSIRHVYNLATLDDGLDQDTVRYAKQMRSLFYNLPRFERNWYRDQMTFLTLCLMHGLN